MQLPQNIEFDQDDQHVYVKMRLAEFKLPSDNFDQDDSESSMYVNVLNKEGDEDESEDENEESVGSQVVFQAKPYFVKFQLNELLIPDQTKFT